MRPRRVAGLVVGALGAALAHAAADPIPAEPPIGGVWWTVVVPTLLLLVAFGATLLLYRHFAGRDPGE